MKRMDRMYGNLLGFSCRVAEQIKNRFYPIGVCVLLPIGFIQIQQKEAIGSRPVFFTFPFRLPKCKALPDLPSYHPILPSYAALDIPVLSAL